MPRAKAPTNPVFGWQITPARLAPAIQTRLLGAAGLQVSTPHAKRLLAITREALGEYPQLVAAYDAQPRPASRAVALAKVEQALASLTEALDGLDIESCDAILLARPDVSPGRMRQLLTQLADGVTIAKQGLEASPRESRGATSRTARRMVITRLSDAFRRLSSDATDEDLVGFLRIACEAASIDLPDTPTKILALLE